MCQAQVTSWDAYIWIAARSLAVLVWKKDTLVSFYLKKY